MQIPIYVQFEMQLNCSYKPAGKLFGIKSSVLKDRGS